MRNVRFLLAAFMVSAVGVWAACGDDNATVGSSNDQDSGSNTPPSGTGTLLPPDPPPPPPSGQDDSGTTIDLDGGPIIQITDAGIEGFDGSIPCLAGGQLEEEINDNEAGANEITVANRTRCGVVLNVDGGTDGGDVDIVKFKIADESRHLYVQVDSTNVDFELFTEGEQPLDLVNPPQGATITFHRPQDYYVQIKSHDGQSHPWRVTVFQNP